MPLDTSAALACVLASQAAYSETTLQTPLAHVLIKQDGQAVIVAFRGTANVRDALTDAECFPLDNHLHRGFDHAYDSIAVPLMDALVRLVDDGGENLYFTGHSLGGALAVLAGWFFYQHYPTAKVITFGQPRIGNAQFAAMCKARLQDRHWRFVNQEDVVPRLPLWTMGFRHSGQELFFPSICGMKLGPPLWLKLLSDVYGTYMDWRQGHIAQFCDHHVDRYVQAVKSNLCQ